MRKFVFIGTGALILTGLSGVALAQVDAGVDAGPGVTTGSCPTGVVEAVFSGENTQSGRLFRDGTPSVCGPAKAYPGIFNGGSTFNFESFTFANTSASEACVTVNFNPDATVVQPGADAGTAACGTNAHASAYLSSYDPTNQEANFIGDVGSSTAQPFFFTVPATTDLVLVVSNTTTADQCGFAVEVVDLPCQICGDGVLQGEEDCDDGGESATCNSDCTLAACGDSKLNVSADEACDDGPESAGCNVDCSVATCGDSYINAVAGETCDVGAESAACDANCTAASCGDATLNTTAGEACDDGDGDSGDGCSASCSIESSGGGSNGSAGSSSGGSGGAPSGTNSGGSAGSANSAGSAGMAGAATGGGVGGSLSDPGPLTSGETGDLGNEDDGCDCHVAGARSNGSIPLAGVALVLSTLLRRRRKVSNDRR
ncbi:MAG: hypothetical protein RL685_3952 [Pseudomonadota bacterium]|jgi:MYXO-CTERM domain-containing protein